MDETKKTHRFSPSSFDAFMYEDAWEQIKIVWFGQCRPSGVYIACLLIHHHLAYPIHTRGAQPICQQLVHYADAPHKHLSIHLIHLLLSQSYTDRLTKHTENAPDKAGPKNENRPSKLHSYANYRFEHVPLGSNNNNNTEYQLQTLVHTLLSYVAFVVPEEPGKI